MSDRSPQRIVSLLPGLTELVCALDLEDHLEGRSHECDFPRSITDRPVLTSSNYPHTDELDNRQIHNSITNLLQHALSIYKVDDEKLIDLKPDIILTQDHCEVCAVSTSDLTDAVRKSLGPDTEIVSASPSDLQTVFNSFVDIAESLGVQKSGELLVDKIQSRFDEIRHKVKNLQRPNVVAIEWIDPLMTGGNWMPEMIEIAGGTPLLAEAGEHSPWIEWEKIEACNPDVILILPCGYSIEKTRSEMGTLTNRKSWKELKAVQSDRVYILDGNHYFNRPGPRIMESVEILAEIFQPDLFRGQSDQAGWVRYRSTSDTASLNLDN